MIVESVFLTSFFSRLNTFKVEYGVMRNYLTLPDSLGGSDLDILISSKDVNLFYEVFNEVLKDTKGSIISKSKGIVPKICVLGGEKQNYFGVQLDVHHGIIPYSVAEILPVGFVFTRLKTHNTIKVLNDNDAVFIGFLKEIFYNKQCEKYFVEAKNAWNRNKALYLKELHLKYSQDFINLLDNVLSSDLYNSKKVDELGVLGAKELTSGFSNKVNIFKSTFGKMHRFINPFGYSIAFLGVDGAGKTTIIDKITPLLSNAVHKQIYYEHMRPNLLPSIASLFGKKETIGVVTNPHEKEPSGFIGSLFRLTYYSIDYIFGYWFKIYPSIVRKPSLWIFDRYFYDYLMDQRRGRLNLPKWIIKVFQFFIPRPNLIICLGGDPEIIYERKKEVPLKEVQKQVDTLKSFANQEHNAFWIDTTGSLESTIDSVIELIKNNMNKRIE